MMVDGAPFPVPKQSGQVASFPTWTAVFVGLADPDAPVAAVPPTDDDARKALCGAAGCSGPGPWLITAGPKGPRYSVVVPRGGQLVVFPDVGETGTGRSALCPDAPEVVRAEIRDGLLHVHVVELFHATYSWCMEETEGACEEAHDCSEDIRYGDYVFDLARRQLLLYILRGQQGADSPADGPATWPDVPQREADERPLVLATFGPTSVRLHGDDCEQVIPYATP